MSADGPLLLHEMTRGRLEDTLAVDPDTVVLLPVGSIEQHGPHLPLGSDYLVARAKAMAVAERTGSIVAEVLLAGHSPAHGGSLGTISLRPETLRAVLHDAVTSLALGGLKRFLLLNGHEGNVLILRLLVEELRREVGVMVAYPVFHGPAERLAARCYWSLDVHAASGETTLMMEVAPDLVELERLPQESLPGRLLPPELLSLMGREDLSDVDRALIDALMPVHDKSFGPVGAWTTEDRIIPSPGGDDLSLTIDMLVEFLTRWKRIAVTR